MKKVGSYLSAFVFSFACAGMFAGAAQADIQPEADTQNGNSYVCRYKVKDRWENWEGIPRDQSSEGAKNACNKSLEKFIGDVQEKCQDCSAKPSVSVAATWACRGDGLAADKTRKSFGVTIQNADTEAQALGLFSTWWDYSPVGPKKGNPPYELIANTAKCSKP